MQSQQHESVGRQPNYPSAYPIHEHRDESIRDTAREPSGVWRKNFGPRQCTHLKKNGERCTNNPVRGGTVCPMHGGDTPLARQAAFRRLLSLVEPALVTLHMALSLDCTFTLMGEGENAVVLCSVHGKQCPEWNSRIQAAKAILDRAGFGPKATLAVENADKTVATLNNEQLANELEQLTIQLRQRKDGVYTQELSAAPNE